MQIGRGIDAGPAIEDVVAGTRKERVVERVTGAVGGASRQQAQVLDVGEQGIASQRAVDGIGAAGRGHRIGLVDDVTGIVDVIDIGAIAPRHAVRADAAVEGVGPGVAGEGVVEVAARQVLEGKQRVAARATGCLGRGDRQADSHRRRRMEIGGGIDAGPAVEDVVASPCEERVGEGVTGAVGGAGRQQAQVLDVGAQGIGAQGAVDAVGAAGGGRRAGLADDIEQVVDVIDIGAISPEHAVETQAANEHIVARAAVEVIVRSPAGQLVVPCEAFDDRRARARPGQDIGRRIPGDAGQPVAGRIEALRMHVGDQPGGIVGLPGDHIAAIDQECDTRKLLDIAGSGIDPDLSPNLDTAGVEALGEDTRGIATAVATPDQEVTAVYQGGDLGLALEAHGGRVDPHLCADLGTDGVEELHIGVRGAIDTVQVGLPGDHEATIGQRRDGGFVLGIQRVGVDADLTAHLGAADVEALREDAVGVAASGPLPHRQVAAIGQPRDGGEVLGAGSGRVDHDLPADLDAIDIVTLQATGPAAAILAIGRPGDHEATIGKPGDLGIVLQVQGGGVDPGFATQLDAGGAIALHEDLRVPGGAFGDPGHHIAAVEQGSHGRVVLYAGHDRIDAGFHTYLEAPGVVALGEYAISVARSSPLPHHHIAAVGQRHDVGLVLVARGGGVYDAFTINEGRHDEFHPQNEGKVPLRGLGIWRLELTYHFDIIPSGRRRRPDMAYAQPCRAAPSSLP
ncbi:hypothetical protein D3C84_341370 [compost metagenome]